MDSALPTPDGLTLLARRIAEDKRRRRHRLPPIDKLKFANLQSFLNLSPARRDHEIATTHPQVLHQLWLTYFAWTRRQRAQPLSVETLERILARLPRSIYTEEGFAARSPACARKVKRVQAEHAIETTVHMARNGVRLCGSSRGKGRKNSINVTCINCLRRLAMMALARPRKKRFS